MNRVFVSPDLSPALRLKELIGRERVAGFGPGQHPLGAGFATLSKKVVGTTDLSVGERQSLGHLNLMARLIWKYEPFWRPHEHRFVGDLCSAARCKAVLFELHVMCFGLENRVGQLEWRRYLEGQPDILTHEPHSVVECKLVQSDDFRRRPELALKQVGKARRQPHPEHVSHIVAVGFKDNMTVSERSQIEKSMAGKRNWFRAHPDVAAVLIFCPAALPEDPSAEVLGWRGIYFDLGDVVEVINWNSLNPLPRGFSLGSQQEVSIGPSSSPATSARIAGRGHQSRAGRPHPAPAACLFDVFPLRRRASPARRAAMEPGFTSFPSSI